MFSFLLNLLGAILIIAIILGIWSIILIGLIWVLANVNAFFCFGFEDRAIIIEMGKKYFRTIIGRRNTDVDAQTGQIINLTPPNAVKRNFFAAFLASQLGIYWIGIWPICSVYRHKQKWMTWELIPGTEKYAAVAKEKWLYHVLLSAYPYYFRAEGLECTDEIPLDVECVVTSQIINPYKSVYLTPDWLRLMDVETKAAAKNFITSKSYRELTADKSAAKDALAQFIFDALHNYMLTWGVEVLKVSINQIAPPKDFIVASTERYVAEQKGLATIETAKASAEAAKFNKEATVTNAEATQQAAILAATGTAQAIRTTGTAEAERLETIAIMLKEHPEAGIVIGADAAKNLPQNTVIITGGLVDLPGQLMGLARSFLSKSKSSDSEGVKK